MLNRRYFHEIPLNNSWNEVGEHGSVKFTFIYPIGILNGRNLTIQEYKDATPGVEYSDLMAEEETRKIFQR